MELQGESQGASASTSEALKLAIEAAASELGPQLGHALGAEFIAATQLEREEVGAHQVLARLPSCWCVESVLSVG